MVVIVNIVIQRALSLCVLITDMSYNVEMENCKILLMLMQVWIHVHVTSVLLLGNDVAVQLISQYFYPLRISENELTHT